jgi:hypothetical protein
VPQHRAAARRELHRLVDALEELYDGRVDAYAAGLGHHFGCGERWAKAEYTNAPAITPCGPASARPTLRPPARRGAAPRRARRRC